MKNLSTKAFVSGLLPFAVYKLLRNAKLSIEGRPYRIEREFDDGSYRVTDFDQSIRVARRGRHSRYAQGITKGLEKVAARYHLDRLDIEPGACLIDCGANIGELGFFARSKGMHYFPVEPEELEAKCCDANNFDGDERTRRFALWKEDGSITFYSNPTTGDSSAFDPEDGSKKVEIPCRTLASVCEDADLACALDVDSTHVLKVEAEGAEPEILEGAAGVLKRFKFVVVDCGRERGKFREDTFLACHKMLSAAGFSIAFCEMKQLTIAYQRNEIQVDP